MNDGWENDSPWLENDGFVKTLIDKVDFLDILDRYGLEYQRTGSANSSHKLRCPFPAHYNGGERTPSLHISTAGNMFKCFGCNAGGTIIDFVMLYRGMPRYKAIEEIAKISGFTEDDIDKEFVPIHRDLEQLVLTHVYRAGILIRDHLNQIKHLEIYPKWEKQASKWFKKLDYFMLELEDDQWETAKTYYDRIVRCIKKYNK